MQGPNWYSECEKNTSVLKTFRALEKLDTYEDSENVPWKKGMDTDMCMTSYGTLIFFELR